MKRLLIAAVVLAGLGIGLYFSNKQEAAKEAQPDPKAPPKVLEVKTDDLRSITIQRKDQPPVTLERSDAGEWSITAPDKLPADQGAVSAIATAAANVDADRVVDANVTDLAAYGLEQPALAIAFTGKDGQTKRLRFGNDTPDKSAVFAKRDDDPRLFTVATFTKTNFDKTANDLRDRHLLSFDSDKLTSVELSPAGKPSVTFERTGDRQWLISKPKVLRADSLQVDELVRAVHDLQLDPAADAAPFASARPVATVKLTGASGAMSLEVRQIAGQYYAKSSALPRAYAVPADIGMSLDKPLEDFRNAKLFDFGFDDTTTVEITDKGIPRVLLKEKDTNGDKWVSGGKTMDNVAVQNLLDKLRELSAIGYDGQPVTQAEMTVKVVSNNGKRTETVQLQQRGDNFSAKRSDAPTVYNVDASAVAGIREALAAVREASTSDNNKK